MKTKLLRRIRRRYFAYQTEPQSRMIRRCYVLSDSKFINSIYTLVNRRTGERDYFASHADLVSSLLGLCASGRAISRSNKRYKLRLAATALKKIKNIL